MIKEPGRSAGNSRNGGRSVSRPWQLAGCLLILFCLTCSGVLAAAGLILISQETAGPRPVAQTTPVLVTSAPPLVTIPPAPSPATTDTDSIESDPTIPIQPTVAPTEDPVLELPVPQDIEQRPSDQMAFDALQSMLEMDLPARDYFENAQRLGNQDLGKRTVERDLPTLGERTTFNSDEGPIEAELLAITEHIYFWAEVSLNYTQTEMARYGQRFEEEYLPQINFLFGQEWRPGIDNDPRFSVLHLDGLASSSELGFFDSGDEYPAIINSVSNEQEIVYLNMGSLDLGEDLYFGTLAHEIEHLFLWNSDPNEPVWMSEGLAQLTELYIGFDTVDTVIDYLANSNIQLNSWEYEDEDAVLAHYGAAYLFTVYLWEQFGDQAIIDLVQNPANGLGAVADLIPVYRPESSFYEFLGDWAVANYLDGESDDARFHYDRLELGRPSYAIEVKQPPFQTTSKTNQFGAHYALLDMTGEATISFAGDTRQAFTSEPRSGSYVWYAPGQDEVDATLTASIDLSGVSSANLTFWCWYELEEDFDFAYVSVSGDNGETWELLTPDHAQAGEFGPALGGESRAESDQVDGWVQEGLSLNKFVGASVLLRFEVVTDSALTGAGFAVDDIAIPELGFLSDAESASDDWHADGFIRTTSYAPQMWDLRLIRLGADPNVTTLEVGKLKRGQWQVNLGQDGAVVMIMAQTPFIQNPASYWLAIDR